MRILNKIVDSGVIVGYRVEDGTFVLPMCKKALYIEMYIEQLTRDGYKYYGYDADAIETPDGHPITELPEVALSEQDDMEWFASVNAADSSALSDADASRYYTFREASIYSFRKEDSYEINTREELIRYLTGLRRAMSTANFFTDCRPLNAFVNPDALFTIEELENDADVRIYFDIIVKRHHMRNYGEYRNLIKWLCDRGALATTTPSIAEFLAAYYAWGPEGIKDKCTGYELKMNVDGVFSFAKDPLRTADGMSYIIDNRVKKATVINGNDELQYLKVKQSLSDISEVKDFGRMRIAVSSNDTLFALRRRDQKGMKYHPTSSTFVSDVTDRLYFTLVTESGFTYTYKVAHNKLKIGLTHTNTNSSVYYTEDNFGIASVTPLVLVPLDAVDCENDYYFWNLAILKAAELVKIRSKQPPYKSTTEFLVSDGVNPIATVDMMAKAITSHGGYQVNRKYSLTNKDDDLLDALSVYMRGIPDYILKAYMIAPEDITEGMQSFLELADPDDLKDRREEMMAMRIGPNDPGFDPTYMDYQSKIGKRDASFAMAAALLGASEKKIDAVDYYTKVKFVADCIHGNLSVNNFGDGLKDDLGVNYGIGAECILSIIYAEYGNNPDKEQASRAILDIENSGLVDVKRIFRMRDHAWKGYMVDYAEYRQSRANENAWIWAYCTKVFREISNAPIEKQRPYLMEIVMLENTKQDMPIRTLMTQCVKDAIEATDFDTTRFDSDGTMSNWSEKKVAMASADYIAARLFFYIYAGGVKGEPVDGMYNVQMQLQEGMTINVPLLAAVVDIVKKFNVNAHRRYITVYDYCKYEYNAYTKDGAFNICLVNADVDPWHVRPKQGFKIKTYSLLPNYYGQDALDSANGAGFYLKAYNDGGICVSPLKELYKSQFIPYSEVEETLMYEGISKSATSLTDMEDFLYPEQYEYIFAYIKRWTLAKKLAASKGKKLYSIPLKQDIVFAEFAYSYCDELPLQECVFVDEVNERAAQTNVSVGVISWRDYVNGISLLSSSSSAVTMHPFSIRDIDLSDTDVLEPIISGKLECSMPIVVSGNYLIIRDGDAMRIPVSKLAESEFDQFVKDGVFYPITNGKHFVHAVNGDYVIDVAR